MPNKNIIFVHIPKTGGSTLAPILSKKFTEEEVYIFTAVEYGNYNAIYSLPSDKKKKIKLLIGHFPFGMHDQLHGESEYITFLRDPIERLRSQYYFIKRRPENEYYQLIYDNKWTFKDFALQSKELGLSNIYVHFLSGFNGENQTMLETAMTNVNRYFRFVGFQECYDESLLLLNKKYKLKLWYYKKKNITNKAVKVDDLDKETIDYLKAINKEDYILYDLYKTKFESEIGKLRSLRIQLLLLKILSTIYSSTKFKLLRKQWSNFTHVFVQN